MKILQHCAFDFYPLLYSLINVVTCTICWCKNILFLNTRKKSERFGLEDSPIIQTKIRGVKLESIKTLALFCFMLQNCYMFQVEPLR